MIFGTAHSAKFGTMGHRKQREGQILRLIDKNVNTIPAMVHEMYKGIDKRLHPAAGRSVLAHLVDLQERSVVAEGADGWVRGGV